MKRTIITFSKVRKAKIFLLFVQNGNGKMPNVQWDVHLWTVNKNEQVHIEHWTFSCTSICFFLFIWNVSFWMRCKWQKHRHLHTILRVFWLVFVHCVHIEIIWIYNFFYTLLYLRPLFGEWKSKTRSQSEGESSFSTKWCSTFTMFKFSTWLCLSARKIECCDCTTNNSHKFNIPRKTETITKAWALQLLWATENIHFHWKILKSLLDGQCIHLPENPGKKQSLRNTKIESDYGICSANKKAQVTLKSLFSFILSHFPSTPLSITPSHSTIHMVMKCKNNFIIKTCQFSPAPDSFTGYTNNRATISVYYN